MSLAAMVVDLEWWPLLVRQVYQLTALIAVVAMVVRFGCKNRPHVAHALWALVLVKCLTPPVIAFPISPFSWIGADVPARTAQIMPNGDRPPRTVDSKDAPRLRSSQRRPIEFASSVPSERHSVPNQLRTDSFNASPSSSAPSWIAASSTATRLAKWSVRIWLIGSVVALIVLAVRLIRFMRNVNRKAVCAHDTTVELLRKTIADMGLNCRRIERTRVQVVDCLIGPAVVGIWRPRILLPRVLESESSAIELRMLLAHELTHVRRGDLRWALVQTLACCLWWFHPLMKSVSRRFDHATELSCDEEVVARLQCKPAEYARGLLMVLNRKHELHVAPALPGVRPLEITLERMERIMKLKNDAKRHRPRWITLAWIVGAVLILPGAARTVAQDEQDRDSGTTHKRGVTVAIANDVSDQVTVREHDASEALAKILTEQRGTRDHAEMILGASLETVAGDGSRIIVHGDKVIARATGESHQQIQNELKRIEDHGFSEQVVIQTILCTVPETAFRELQLDWQLVQHHRNQQPVVASLMNPEQLRKFINEFSQNTQANILNNPKVTTFNGRRVNIESGVHRPFFVGDTLHHSGDDSIRAEYEGIQLSVQPVHKSRFTELTVGFTQSMVSNVENFTFGVGGEETMTVQVPRIAEQHARVSMSIPDNQSIAIAMPSVSIADEVLICMVTPRLITEEDLPPADATADASQSPALPVAQAMYQANVAAPPRIAEASDAWVPTRPNSLTQPNAAMQSRSLETWLMKADGPPPSEEIIKRCEELLVAFDAQPRMEGDWLVSSSSDETKLGGKNLSITIFDDDLNMRCASGELIVTPSRQSIEFQADSGEQWQASVPALGLTLKAERIKIGENGWSANGDPLQLGFECDDAAVFIAAQAETLTMNDEVGLRLENNVQLVVNGGTIAANTATLVSGESSKLELKGDVHAVRGKTDIRCQSAVLDLASGKFQLPD